jgi:hypothetical protein
MRTISYLLVALALATIPVAQNQEHVFPSKDSITGAPPVDTFRQEWYSKHLIAMGETVLPDGPSEVYRFLWLRTFSNPIMIRLACDARGCDLTSKRLDGKGGYEPGKVVERKERRLSGQEATSIRRMLGKTQFWSPQPKDQRIGLDGAQWILEGTRENGYHLWDAWSPELSGPYADFRELCMELVRLSGLLISPIEVY